MGMESLTIEDCINARCPWSGEPVAADSLMRYRGKVIGFCKPSCRDKFEKAVTLFDKLIEPAKLQH
jgi:hypothetical protein